MDQFNSELEQTLRTIISAPSTEAVKSASDRLREHYYKNPQVVPALVNILQQHPEPQLRQIAGVEARKLVHEFWRSEENESLDEQTMVHIQNSLMQSTLHEQHELVRHTSARVISAIAFIDLAEESWPDLIPTLLAAAQSKVPQEREVAVYILYTLLDQDYSNPLQSSTSELLQLLSQTIKDPESLQVRVSSVVALSKLGEMLETPEQTQVFQSTIPSIVEVLSQAVHSDDEKSALQVFEALNDLVIGEPALLGNFFGELVQHIVSQYCIPENVETEYRNNALQFVYNAVRFRGKRVQSLQLGPFLTKACIEILAQPNEDDDDEDDDGASEDTTPSRVSLRIIDVLATSLPPSQVLRPLMDLLPSLVNGTPHQARAGYLALSFSIEGAPDFVTNEIETILPLIVQGLNSSSSLVQVSALQALCMLAVELPSLVSKEHEVLLPLVFNIMDGATSLQIGRSACSTLDSILESLDRKIITEKYLNALVPKFLSLVQNINDSKLKGTVVNAIASSAFAAGQNFIPYFAETVNVIQQFITIPQPNVELSVADVRLCAMTIDALGTLCCAVGAETFRPCLEPTMHAIVSFLQTSVSELRECSFIFIGTAAKVFNADFVPYLDSVMPPLFATFEQQEFNMEETVDEDLVIGANDDEEDMMDNIKVNSAVALEKEYACDCLTELVQHIPPQIFAQYIPKELEVLGELVEHFYEDIRKSAIIALWKTLGAYFVAERGDKTWTPGFPVTDVSGLLETIGDKVRDTTIQMLFMEDDRSVVSATFDCMTNAIRNCGPVVLGSEEDLTNILTFVYEVLNKDHRCQNDDDDEDEDDDEEEDPVFGSDDLTESDEALIDFSIDLVVQIAAALGEQFAPIFPTAAGIFRNYTESKNPSERTSGIGAFAELVNSMQSNASGYTEAFLEIFLCALGDKKLAVRSVAAYGIGLLCYFSTESEVIKSSYATILPKLQHLLEKVEKSEKRRAKSAVDEEEVHNDQRSLANACGCVARMALKYPENIPLEHVIPVLLSRLPLSDAFEENEPIFELLLQLLQKKEPTIISHSNELLRVMVNVYEQQSLSDQLNSLKSVGEPSAASQLQDPDARKAANKIVQLMGEMQPDILTTYPILSAAAN